MPVIDTIVLFAAADKEDKQHRKAVSYLKKLKEKEFYVPTYALLEYDIVLKSRGLTFDERMEIYSLLIKDFPELYTKVLSLNPTVLYLVAKFEKDFKLEYFDAGVAAEALQYDKVIVSTDKTFDKIPYLKRVW